MSMNSTSDGGYVIAGNCWAQNGDGDVVGVHGGTDWWVVKVNATGDIQWARAFGGSDDESQPIIQQTSDGGFIITGNGSSSNGDISGNHGLIDIWILKLGSTGNIEWEKSVGGSSFENPVGTLETSDGGYLVGGISKSNDGDASGSHGGSDLIVIKLSSSGFIQWIKVFGGSKDDELKNIIKTTDGGYIIAGATSSNDGDVTGFHAETDFWIVKLSSDGVMEWEKALGGTNDEEPASIIQTNDGGYITVGYTYSTDGDVAGNHGIRDWWIVKLTSFGVLQWQKTLGGSQSDYARSVQEASDGGYIIGGATYSNDGDVTGNHGGSSFTDDYWLVKIDKDGAILWKKTLGGTLFEDNIYSIKMLNDGGYVLAGESPSSDGDVPGNQGFIDAWVLRLNNAGEIIWKKSMGGSNYDSAYHIEPTADGGYMVGCRSGSNNGDVTGQHGAGDYWLVKLSPDMVGSEDNASLHQATYPEVFPNPSMGSVYIKLSLEEPFLSIRIFNLLGQAVSEKIIPNGGALDISSLPDGIYSIVTNTPSGKFFTSIMALQK